MKRHNLVIIALLALSLCATGAMAQDSKLVCATERAPANPQNELSPSHEAAPVPTIPSHEGWTNNEFPYTQGGNEVPAYGKGEVLKPIYDPYDPGNVTPQNLPGLIDTQ